MTQKKKAVFLVHIGKILGREGGIFFFFCKFFFNRLPFHGLYVRPHQKEEVSLQIGASANCYYDSFKNILRTDFVHKILELIF